MDSILIKTLAAVILGFVISAVLGKYLVPALRRWKAGQAIKEDGPTWHMSKQGTPTMGGILFILGMLAALIAAVLNMRLKRAVPVIFLGVAIAGCIITLLTHGVTLLF